MRTSIFHRAKGARDILIGESNTGFSATKGVNAEYAFERNWLASTSLAGDTALLDQWSLKRRNKRIDHKSPSDIPTVPSI